MSRGNLLHLRPCSGLGSTSSLVYSTVELLACRRATASMKRCRLHTSESAGSRTSSASATRTTQVQSSGLAKFIDRRASSPRTKTHFKRPLAGRASPDLGSYMGSLGSLYRVVDRFRHRSAYSRLRLPSPSKRGLNIRMWRLRSATSPVLIVHSAGSVRI